MTSPFFLPLVTVERKGLQIVQDLPISSDHAGFAPHLSQHVGVEDLEDLVEPKLAEALHGVADGGRCPALGQRPESLLTRRHSEPCEHVLVLLGVHLD